MVSIPMWVLFPLIVIAILVGFFLLHLSARIQRVERDLGEERKDRRALGYELDRHKWEAFAVYRLLGAEKRAETPAAWVKKDG